MWIYGAWMLGVAVAGLLIGALCLLAWADEKYPQILDRLHQWELDRKGR